MRKSILGIAVLLCALAASAQTSAPEIRPPANGDEWLRLSSTEKLFWAIGYSQGYQEALSKIDVTSGTNQSCVQVATRTERQTSTAGKITGFEIVSSLEKFYSDGANTVIPVPSAMRIVLLQQSGKDPAAIQELIDTARLLGAESRRTASK
jgi:hypothetical protein